MKFSIVLKASNRSSRRSSRSSSRKSSVDQGYNPPPPPPQEDDDSGFFIIKILIVIGVLGAVFGAGIGVGSAIWNKECPAGVPPTPEPDVTIIPDDFTGTLPTLDPNSTLPELNFTLPDFTGTMPTGTFATELVTGTEAITGTEATGTMATGTMETGTTGMRFQLCPLD